MGRDAINKDFSQNIDKIDKAFEDASNTVAISYLGYNSYNNMIEGIFKKCIHETDASDFLSDIIFAIHNRFQKYSIEDISSMVYIEDFTDDSFIFHISVSNED